MAKVKFGSVLNVAILAIVIYVIYVIYGMLQQSIIKNPSLRISAGEAKARRFGLIIDVRTLKEREELGYYPNSIPMSLDMINKEVPFAISNKNTWILIYCNSGSRAVNAAEILYRMGYNNVRYIKESYLSLMPGSS